MEYVSASLIRAGHQTKACQEKNTLRFIESWWPDFLAFQVLTGDQDRWGAIARSAKQKYPHIKTIFGGPHFLFFSKIKQNEADIIIRGEGEFAIIDAVEGRQHIDLKATEDLDTCAHPDRSLLYNDEFPGVKNNVIRNFLATRSCIYKCKYCYNSNPEWQKMMGSKRINSHSPEWIIEDIKSTFKDYGGQFVSFQDDIFGIDMAWLEKFCKLYQKVRIPFFAQLRPRLITEDRVRLLKDAGIHIASFAVESGNEQTRRLILDREESNEVISKGCQLLHKYGIKFRMQNLLGLPVDNPLEDALETLRFNMKQRPTLSWASALQCYPGTTIADYVVKIGLVKSMEELEFLTNATFFEECSLPIKNKKQVERLHKYWSAVVRWQWLYPIVRLLIYINFGDKIHRWIFNTSKNYINKREYWRVKHLDKHVSITSKQYMGHLHHEPQIVEKVAAEVCP